MPVYYYEDKMTVSGRKRKGMVMLRTMKSVEGTELSEMGESKDWLLASSHRVVGLTPSKALPLVPSSP